MVSPMAVFRWLCSNFDATSMHLLLQLSHCSSLGSILFWQFFFFLTFCFDHRPTMTPMAGSCHTRRCTMPASAASLSFSMDSALPSTTSLTSRGTNCLPSNLPSSNGSSESWPTMIQIATSTHPPTIDPRDVAPHLWRWQKWCVLLDKSPRCVALAMAGGTWGCSTPGSQLVRDNPILGSQIQDWVNAWEFTQRCCIGNGWGCMGVLNSRKTDSDGQRQFNFGFTNPRLGKCLRIHPVMFHWQWLGAPWGCSTAEGCSEEQQTRHHN